MKLTTTMKNRINIVKQNNIKFNKVNWEKLSSQYNARENLTFKNKLALINRAHNDNILEQVRL
jgi:hypothetical protein